MGGILFWVEWAELGNIVIKSQMYIRTACIDLLITFTQTARNGLSTLYHFCEND